MKVLHPYFYTFLFFNFTVFLPILINGIRIVSLWYSPLSDTGQQTFIFPFLTFTIIYLACSSIFGYFLYRHKENKFILVKGDFTVLNIMKSLLNDKAFRKILIFYSFSYLVSFLIVSGVILIPNINISPYFLKLTIITYDAYGIQTYFNFFVLNIPMIVFALLNTLILSFAFMLSYYTISLMYVSYNLMKWKVPRTFRIATTNMVGGFLTASVPSIGTIAGICCLTPTAINSLLYLASSSFPLISKNLVWKYTIYMGMPLLSTISQLILLSSPVFAGVAILSLSLYSLIQISKKLREGLLWQRQ
ncbi:MAG: hypothetical protein QXY87_07560 [Saccharolobus sp.]|uniref:Putative integral membrane protein n=2 Tax=Saccharolobus TaxID=2100760 RepID=A0A8F5BST8_9CREN|nr:hypothetical protein [Saccharolobus shibatae]MCH4815564.1 hypothetical protein [Saccharolobus shibatae]QXJ30843.1 putative integral membrane protein [Saccharolobus shibatae]